MFPSIPFDMTTVTDLPFSACHQDGLRWIPGEYYILLVGRLPLTWSWAPILNQTLHLLQGYLAHCVDPESFSSSESILTVYKSLIRTCIEYCYNIKFGILAVYLKILDKMQKTICNVIDSDQASRADSFFQRSYMAFL